MTFRMPQFFIQSEKFVYIFKKLFTFSAVCLQLMVSYKKAHVVSTPTLGLGPKGCDEKWKVNFSPTHFLQKKKLF